MKKIISLIICASALSFTGCGTVGGLFTQQQTVTPVVTPQLVTNTVAQIVTDQAGATFTNFANLVSTNFETNYVTNVTYAVAPKVQSYIGAAQSVNQAIPTPWQSFLALGFAGLSGVLGLVAKFKSDKASILPSVIAGVEAAGNADVKKSIQSMALANGVEGQLSALVQKLT